MGVMGVFRRALRLLAGNLFILFVMLTGLNFLAALGYDARAFLDQTFMPVSEKAGRDSFADKVKSKEIFREFSQLHSRYVPYLVWQRESFAGKWTTVGADGDRLHAPVPANPVGHVRMFGGSTMWGKGVDDSHTIPATLASLRPDFAVYNHGESAFVSRQAFERLVNTVNSELPIDVAVFYDGCNDFFTLCREDTSINGHSNEPDMARRLRPPSYAADVLFGAVRDIIFYAWGRSLKAVGPPSRCQDEPGAAERVARGLVNNWKNAKAIAEARGIEIHAILQPVAAVGSPNLSHLDYLRNDPPSRSADYAKLYPIVKRMMAEEGGDWMHDFSDVFDGGETVYIDGCHVNDRGNEIIAKRIDALIGGRLDELAAARPPL
jgi:hypothetical protein